MGLWYHYEWVWTFTLGLMPLGNGWIFWSSQLWVKKGGALSTLSGKLSRPVHILQQQYLIYWKQYQQMHREYWDFCWQFLDHMEIWSLWWNKTACIPCCGIIRTIVWIQHWKSNETCGKKKGEMGTTSECYVMFYKNPGNNILPIRSCTVTCLPSHKASKMNKKCWALMWK